MRYRFLRYWKFQEIAEFVPSVSFLPTDGKQVLGTLLKIPPDRIIVCFVSGNFILNVLFGRFSRAPPTGPYAMSP
jgi:hypothetical protein